MHQAPLGRTRIGRQPAGEVELGMVGLGTGQDFITKISDALDHCGQLMTPKGKRPDDRFLISTGQARVAGPCARHR